VKLLAKFPDQAAMNLRQIADSLASGDAKQVSRAAHGLKGTAANLSAPAVQRLAAEIEKLGAAGSLSDVERTLAQLQKEVDRCVVAVRQLSEPETARAGGE
jgi:HPt (histidine-containing phosphotransfer) domain-containing protein